MRSVDVATGGRFSRDGPAVDVLGIRIDAVTRSDLLEEIATAISRRQFLRVYFVNPHTVNLARSHPDFIPVLNRGERVMADGIGIVWAARWLTGVRLEQISTDRLAPALFAQARDRGHRVFLLGAAPEICARAAVNLAQQYEGLHVVGHHSPDFAAVEDMDNAEIFRRIKASAPDILVVALGNLKQEPWVDRFGSDLGVPVILAAGGYLDYVAGAVKYAPQWCHRMNVVWMYRLLHEPRRLWRRYLHGIPIFLWQVAGAWLRSRASVRHQPS